MKHSYILWTLFILFISCNSNGISTNGSGVKVFTYEPTGWKMAIPDGWEVLTEAERDKLNYAAQNYYEEATTRKHAAGEKKIILGVRKAEKDMNACYAFVRSYARDEDYPSLRDLLKQQYSSYSADMYRADTSLTKEVIEGRIFEKAILSVQYNSHPYFTYTTYSTMLDTLNFGVSIVGNNDSDREMLIRNFRESIKSIHE